MESSVWYTHNLGLVDLDVCFLVGLLDVCFLGNYIRVYNEYKRFHFNHYKMIILEVISQKHTDFISKYRKLKNN